MATYNGEKFIYEQLRSILNQLGAYDEIVISDDHSIDRTVNIIKSFSDPRIRLIFNKAERGYTRNFENALQHASGDIIFISDQDDVWRPDKIKLVCCQLQGCDIVISDATYVDQNLQPTHGSHFQLTGVARGSSRQLLKPRYIGACMAFHRLILTRLLPFPRMTEYCPYDYWLTLIGEACYKVQLIHEPLILYRRHDSNISPAGMKSPNSLSRKLLIRGYSLAALVARVVRSDMRKPGAL